MTNYEKGQWDMFELITCAFHGKQYYFMDNEKKKLVYSRDSHKVMLFEDAVKEFLDFLQDWWEV